MALPHDRMFHVLVLGGIGLVSQACGSVASSPAEEGDAAVRADAVVDAHRAGDADATFPSELPVVAADAFPSEGPTVVDAFPSELAVEVDAFPAEGPVAVDAGQSADAFPSELPVFVEAGHDAGTDAGFPIEK